MACPPSFPRPALRHGRDQPLAEVAISCTLAAQAVLIFLQLVYIARDLLKRGSAMHAFVGWCSGSLSPPFIAQATGVQFGVVFPSYSS
jgi:hypothetical protein